MKRRKSLDIYLKNEKIEICDDDYKYIWSRSNNRIYVAYYYKEFLWLKYKNYSKIFISKNFF